MNSNQEQNKATDSNAATIEKRPYEAPEVVEFTPSVWAFSGSAH
jgi:hypothetical protein